MAVIRVDVTHVVNGPVIGDAYRMRLYLLRQSEGPNRIDPFTMKPVAREYWVHFCERDHKISPTVGPF